MKPGTMIDGGDSMEYCPRCRKVQPTFEKIKAFLKGQKGTREHLERVSVYCQECKSFIRSLVRLKAKE